MKTKLIICAMAALLLAPAVSHARWGLEAAANLGSVDDEDMSRNLHYVQGAAPANGYNMNGEISKNTAEGNATLFVEGNAPFRLGISAGYGRLPEISSRVNLWGPGFYNLELQNKTQMLQAALYMKYAGSRFSVYGGGGAAFVDIETRYNSNYNGGGEGATFKQSKVVPQAQAGCEVFLAKWLSLNVGVKMLFGAVFDDLKGDVMAYGANLAKQKLIMARDSYGEAIRYTSGALAQNERPFQYDLGGARASAGIRIYFK